MCERRCRLFGIQLLRELNACLEDGQTKEDVTEGEPLWWNEVDLAGTEGGSGGESGGGTEGALK